MRTLISSANRLPASLIGVLSPPCIAAIDAPIHYTLHSTSLSLLSTRRQREQHDANAKPTRNQRDTDDANDATHERATMNAVNQLPEHQKPAFMASLEAMQTKDSLRMYNDLVERCYLQCVTSFRSQSLNETEKTCVASCAEKYIKLTQRVGFRFAEHQAQQGQQAQLTNDDT